jgi:ArsR family transcriptional regulator, arsenate/arsenite/antimonite-responsive transcriptional repressor
MMDYICQGIYNRDMEDRVLASLETLFKALADRTRLRILGLLVNGEVCVCHIHDSLGITQPMASRHLAYLRRTGLVTTRKDGLWVHYRLADLPDPVLESVLSAAAHALSHVPTASRDRKRLAHAVDLIPQPAPPPRACCST